MGMFWFSANYENNPKPDTDKSFKKEWLRYFDEPYEEDEEGNRVKMPLSIYLSIDASWADKDSNMGRDPTAIIVGGFRDNGDFYLLEYINKRISPTEVVNKIFDLVSFWQPNAVASEDVNTQKGINKLIEDEMHKRGKYFTLDKIKHQKQTKEGRIMSLEPIFRNGSFYIKPEMKDFIEQYQFFNPVHKITHDDLLDATEMIITAYREIFVAPMEQSNKEYEETFEVFDLKTGRM
jgi:predicted phage terminase large subunit-like protein